MSIVGDLRGRAARLREEADRFIKSAQEYETMAARDRKQAEGCNLDAVESDVAANIIENAGLKVELNAASEITVSVSEGVNG